MDLRPAYLQRLKTLAELIGNVKVNQLADPTPCEGFDVRALVNHVVGTISDFARALTDGTHADPGAPQSDLIGDDPGGAIARALDDAERAWSAPGVMERETVPIGRGIPPGFALRIGLIEAVVHGWDLARATHQPYEIPEDVAQRMLEGMRAQMGDMPRPPGSWFGPEVSVPDDATSADKLIAFTGRTP